MKKLFFVIALILSTSNLFSQVKFEDYRDGAEFTHFGTTYRVQNKYYEYIDYWAEKGVYVLMGDINNFRFQHSAQYTDGTYTDNSEDMDDVIISKGEYYKIFKHAMCNAFSRSELSASPKERILIFVIVDNQGNIIETSTMFRVSQSYTPQPEQIAALETMIRKNLKFELDQEKASKFNYFEGQIPLYFGHYLDTLPAGAIDGNTDDLYTIRVAVNEIGSPTPSLGSGSGPLKP